MKTWFNSGEEEFFDFRLFTIRTTIYEESGGLVGPINCPWSFDESDDPLKYLFKHLTN